MRRRLDELLEELQRLADTHDGQWRANEQDEQHDGD